MVTFYRAKLMTSGLGDPRYLQNNSIYIEMIFFMTNGHCKIVITIL